MLRKTRGLIPTVETKDEGRQTPWHRVMGGLVSLGDPSLVLRSFTATRISDDSFLGTRVVLNLLLQFCGDTC